MTHKAFSSLMLKLGGDCNLNCPHCHCAVPEYEFKPEILDWIRRQPIKRITFNGGEPLMYFERIKQIVTELGDRYEYKFVTNGTLLSTRIIEFCNDHNIMIVVSYDGKQSGRDSTVQPRWELLRFARRCAFSVYTSGDTNAIKLQEDVEQLVGGFKIRKAWNKASIMPNFLHETATTPRRTSISDAQDYLRSLARLIELQLIQYKQTGNLDGKQALVRAVKKWLVPKDFDFGVACCNSDLITLTVDGRFMICPYKPTYCGDIWRGVDVAMIESHIPEKCRRCSIFNVCRNTCLENTTSHECYIAKKINAHLKKLEAKYEIDLVALIQGEI